MASTLPQPALQASRAALSSALAENGSASDAKNAATDSATDNDLEEGEVQEVDMEAQAEGIRTVFSDPTNFNVKVRNGSFTLIIGALTKTQISLPLYSFRGYGMILSFTAPLVLSLDSLV